MSALAMGYALTSSACALGLTLAFSALGAEIAAASKRVLEQTNEFRAAQHVAPVAASRELADAAGAFARFMAKTGKYGHMADGREPAERAAAHGYEYCIVAENIARVYRSRGYDAQTLADDMVAGWKNSPEHRKNMLDSAVTELGVSIARDDQGRYFGVQMFGRPKAAAIRFSVRNDAAQRVHYRAGERSFSLPPRTERTHAVCRPVQLTIELAKPFSARPGDGASYVVVERRGALAVQKDAK